MGTAPSGTASYRSSQFCRYESLDTLSFRDNSHLEAVGQGAFDFICASRLTHLFIETSPKLTMIEQGAFGYFHSLQTLKISESGLTDVPEWGDFSVKGALQVLDLKHNLIKRIKRNAFSAIKGKIGELSLVGNEIVEVEDFAFNDVAVAKINLAGNQRLRILGMEAFSNTSLLFNLDLSNTSIENLPTNGLGKLSHLTIQNVPTLKIFPPVLRFLSVRHIRLTYPYHCCAFKYPRRQNKTLYQQLREELKKTCNSTNVTGEIGYVNKRVARSIKTVVEDIKKHDFSSEELVVQLLRFDDHYDKNDPLLLSLIEDLPNGEVIRIIRRPRSTDDHNGRFGKFANTSTKTDIQNPKGSSGPGKWLAGTVAPNTFDVFRCGVVYEGFKDRDCTPIPDALNPCEDVMGYSWLRVTVWLVVTTAILGNFVVLVVTISCKMTVGKFLMCNLAVADFCLGLYLLILAAYDLHTSGVYFAYAIAWQTEGGCQVAGFLSTFSTCLSIFTLSVITLERWYAISHAINLSKRLRMRQAMFIMVCGWTCALIMASLPLIGVSSYGKTSLCLPMDTDNMLSEIYVIILLIINALAFVVIAVCYFDMYRQVTNPGNTTAAGRNDANIAKRMAILVVTDFACFFPIAFFGITAAAGMPLITVTRSKILLVFFFPLNSCANPFLYAIFTKQFKKDLFRNLNKCNMCTNIAARYRAVYTSTPLSNSQSRSSQAAPTDQSWCGAICSCCICYGGLPDNGDKFNEPRANAASSSFRGHNEAIVVDNPSNVNGIRLLHGSAKVCLHFTINAKDFDNRRTATGNRTTTLTTMGKEGTWTEMAGGLQRSDQNQKVSRTGKDDGEMQSAVAYETGVPNGEMIICDVINNEPASTLHRLSPESDLEIDCLDENESSSNGLLSDNETRSCSSEATQDDVRSLGVASANQGTEGNKIEKDSSCQSLQEKGYFRSSSTHGEDVEEVEVLNGIEKSTLLSQQKNSEIAPCRFITKC